MEKAEYQQDLPGFGPEGSDLTGLPENDLSSEPVNVDSKQENNGQPAVYERVACQHCEDSGVCMYCPRGREEAAKLTETSKAPKVLRRK